MVISISDGHLMTNTECTETEVTKLLMVLCAIIPSEDSLAKLAEATGGEFLHYSMSKYGHHKTEQTCYKIIYRCLDYSRTFKRILQNIDT